MVEQCHRPPRKYRGLAGLLVGRSSAVTTKKKNSRVECRHCGASQQVDFGRCLRHGWPECCGETMMLLSTKANIGAAVGEIVKEAV